MEDHNTQSSLLLSPAHVWVTKDLSHANESIHSLFTYLIDFVFEKGYQCAAQADLEL
jgi:hypothetical protein